MGLDTTHGCWHGAYSSFHRFRVALCVAAGLGDLNMYVGYHGSVPWPNEDQEPLVRLLHHSDCDGSLPVDVLTKLADRMESLLPALMALPWTGDDHNARARQFIAGLRKAAAAGEAVEFR